MFKELKRITIKEVKEELMTMSHQIENISNRYDKKEPNKLCKLKVQQQMKILLEELNSKFELAEERNCKLR